MNNKSINKNDFSIRSYAEKNREAIDESLVSLRFMKEIDLFLERKNISNRSLANELGYTESYISQLMSGVKKVNMSFINRFEKKYDTRFNLFLQEKNDYNVLSIPPVTSMTVYNIQINVSNQRDYVKAPLYAYGKFVDSEEIITLKEI